MLAKRIEKVSPSTTLAISAKAKALKNQGLNVISFTAGEPDFDTPSHIKEAAIKSIKEGFTKYTPTTGIMDLKLAIHEKFKIDNNLEYEPSQIVVSCGAKHSLYNIFQVICQEADEVIIPSPYWISYLEMVKLSGAKPVILETSPENDYKVKISTLKKSVNKRTKAFILNSPSNPTGTVYSHNELKGLAEFFLEHDIFVISDEIYERLIYDGLTHISIASLNKDIFSKTIVVNGPSKTYAMTGWRIGYLGARGDIADAIGRLQDHSTSNPTSISQIAALSAIKGEQGCVSEMVSEFKKRRDVMMDMLEGIEGLRFFKPSGAFYIFCDISRFSLSSEDFANHLLQEALVACIPGNGFGFDTHIRLSFAISLEEIKEGINRISRWVRQLQKK
ncbi:MAG: pyridoxal phosphate-dependent aminotransferase [Candidatus Omnitrophica bacterium]|nr:pyridoxal phosphate-dependent aminotransferase [Candidatus Omnitrophota bacterium]